MDNKAKSHPQVVEGEFHLSPGDKLIDFVRETSSSVNNDENDRSEWLLKQKYFWRRRFAKEFRNPKFPWPGSSDIVMPLIDMMIDKTRPMFSSLIYGQQRIVSFRALNSTGVQNARNAETFFNWFLMHRAEDIQRQIDLAIDNFLQYGHCVYKVFWEHRTVNQQVNVQKSQMVDRYKQVSVMDVTPEEADQIVQMTGGRRVPITRDEFDDLEPNVRMMLRVDYGLDPDDPLDKESEDLIVNMLKTPSQTEVEINRRSVEYSFPKTIAVSPFDIIVPKGTREMNRASRITHRMWYTKEDFEARVRDNIWSEEAAERVLAASGSGRATNVDSLDALHYTGGEHYDSSIDANENLYEVYETYCWYDIDGDGHKEKVVLTYSPTSPGPPLSAVALPFEHGNWPFVKIDSENISDKYYSSRGLPEKLDDLDVEITAQHRAKLNRMMIANSPTFKYKAGSDLQPNQIQWIPGQFLPVINMTDIEAIQIPQLDLSFDKEEQILRTWAEQYVGGTDFGISGQNSLQEARTAQEIRAIETNREQIGSAKARAFQTGMKQVWDMMWDLIMQYQRNDIFISVTGKQPIKMSLEEVRGNFDIVPEGAVGFNDPVFKAQKAMARLQLLSNIAPIIMQNPEDAASFEVSIGEAARNYLEEDDVTVADVIMRRRSPEEKQQILQQAQQRQQLVDDVNQNIPTSPEDLVTYANHIEKKMPHGRAQRVKR